MITLIEALNYRCLQYVQRLLNPFHVLVGPNASGKTAFLDVIGFLRDLVSEGLDTALSARARMGSNLPWVVARLRHKDQERHRAWIAHLQTALPDLVDITTFERPEDKHCYMIYEYEEGLKVPSWLVSDGTLRLTALTLPAYLTDLQGIYLIEEPENGVHPRAVATAYDSLSSMYEAQVLLATHSPVVLSTAGMDDVLCFAKDDDGSTDIVLGSEHPLLQKWQGEVDLGTLLASGVLG